MRAQTSWPENRSSGALLGTAKAREQSIPQMHAPRPAMLTQDLTGHAQR